MSLLKRNISFTEFVSKLQFLASQEEQHCGAYHGGLVRHNPAEWNSESVSLCAYDYAL